MNASNHLPVEKNIMTDHRNNAKPNAARRNPNAAFKKDAPQKPRMSPRALEAAARRKKGVSGDEASKGERIAKILARSGIASRRECETIIEEGRVSVNGKEIVSPALNVFKNDRITVDGQELREAEPPRLWLYHKPLGLVTTNRDEKGRETVFEKLPSDLPRVMSVGRLDLNSEGLLLLTNDGELKRQLELPDTGWLRKYRVRVKGTATEAVLEPLRKGVTVDGENFQPMEITFDRQQGANAWLTVGIREGKNREIRRAMEHIGLTVNRLLRISYGPFRLGSILAGAVEEVKPRVLRDQLGLESEKFDGPQKGPRRQVERSGRPQSDRDDRGPRKPRDFDNRGSDSRNFGKGESNNRRFGKDEGRPERRSRDDFKPRERDDRDKKPYGSKPHGEKSFSKRPYGNKTHGDAKSDSRGNSRDDRRDDRSYDKPREGRSYDKPREDLSYDKPREGRSYDKPREGRSYDKPREGRSYDKPREGRSYDKPREGRSYDKPRKGRSYDKPREGRSYDKPREGRSYDKPREGRSYDKPKEGRSYDKPREGRSYDKPRGKAPYGDKGKREDRGGDKGRHSDEKYTPKSRGYRSHGGAGDKSRSSGFKSHKGNGGSSYKPKSRS